ncbi:hypothetical protein NSK_007075 [Nannochloropsis salina CCMP1776]|uniref:Uncharacterized protein n=1 Tax=Nannochloropsis salina CCMP1776 TaxID=1027361 RepID=A0A4D9CZL9_9STRA|nr:hypothetical protein NSK_007075 [Nannochloropsis salina CCMP1776]|eukprot:TFJ81828.1 hypothetical protein NSK_007075 [Nannochloropsis salina CCMP1776]
MDRFEALYRDAEARKVRRAVLGNKLRLAKGTFKPTLYEASRSRSVSPSRCEGGHRSGKNNGFGTRLCPTGQDVKEKRARIESLKNRYETEGCTFEPQLFSHNVSPSLHDTLPVQDRLARYQAARERRLEMLRAQRENEEASEHAFMPQLVSSSKARERALQARAVYHTASVDAGTTPLSVFERLSSNRQARVTHHPAASPPDFKGKVLQTPNPRSTSPSARDTSSIAARFQEYDRVRRARQEGLVQRLEEERAAQCTFQPKLPEKKRRHKCHHHADDPASTKRKCEKSHSSHRHRCRHSPLISSEDCELAHCTFKPRVSRSPERVREGSVIKRLLREGQDAKKKLQHMRHLQEERDLRGCTFKPHVTPYIPRACGSGASAPAPAVVVVQSPSPNPSPSRHIHHHQCSHSFPVEDMRDRRALGPPRHRRHYEESEEAGVTTAALRRVRDTIQGRESPPPTSSLVVTKLQVSLERPSLNSRREDLHYRDHRRSPSGESRHSPRRPYRGRSQSPYGGGQSSCGERSASPTYSDYDRTGERHGSHNRRQGPPRGHPPGMNPRRFSPGTKTSSFHKTRRYGRQTSRGWDEEWTGDDEGEGGGRGDGWDSGQWSARGSARGNRRSSAPTSSSRREDTSSAAPRGYETTVSQGDEEEEDPYYYDHEQQQWYRREPGQAAEYGDQSGRQTRYTQGQQQEYEYEGQEYDDETMPPLAGEEQPWRESLREGEREVAAQEFLPRDSFDETDDQGFDATASAPAYGKGQQAHNTRAESQPQRCSRSQPPPGRPQPGLSESDPEQAPRQQRPQQSKPQRDSVEQEGQENTLYSPPSGLRISLAPSSSHTDKLGSAETMDCSGPLVDEDGGEEASACVQHSVNKLASRISESSSTSDARSNCRSGGTTDLDLTTSATDLNSAATVEHSGYGGRDTREEEDNGPDENEEEGQHAPPREAVQEEFLPHDSWDGTAAGYNATGSSTLVSSISQSGFVSSGEVSTTPGPLPSTTTLSPDTIASGASASLSSHSTSLSLPPTTATSQRSLRPDKRPHSGPTSSLRSRSSSKRDAEPSSPELSGSLSGDTDRSHASSLRTPASSTSTSSLAGGSSERPHASVSNAGPAGVDLPSTASSFSRPWRESYAPSSPRHTPYDQSTSSWVVSPATATGGARTPLPPTPVAPSNKSVRFSSRMTENGVDVSAPETRFTQQELPEGVSQEALRLLTTMELPSGSPAPKLSGQEDGRSAAGRSSAFSDPSMRVPQISATVMQLFDTVQDPSTDDMGDNPPSLHPAEKKPEVSHPSVFLSDTVPPNTFTHLPLFTKRPKTPWSPKRAHREISSKPTNPFHTGLRPSLPSTLPSATSSFPSPNHGTLPGFPLPSSMALSQAPPQVSSTVLGLFDTARLPTSTHGGSAATFLNSSTSNPSFSGRILPQPGRQDASTPSATSQHSIPRSWVISTGMDQEGESVQASTAAMRLLDTAQDPAASATSTGMDQEGERVQASTAAMRLLDTAQDPAASATSMGFEHLAAPISASVLEQVHDTLTSKDQSPGRHQTSFALAEHPESMALSTTLTNLFDTARPATALSSSGAAVEGQEEEAKDAQPSTTVTRLFDTARPATALSPSSSSGAAGEGEETKDAQPSTTVTRLFDTARPGTALSPSSSSGAAGEGEEEETKDAQPSTTVTKLFDTARPATALSPSSSSGAAGEGQEEEAKDAQPSTTVTRLFDTARPATALSPSSSSGAAGEGEEEEAKDAQPSTTVTRLLDTARPGTALSPSSSSGAAGEGEEEETKDAQHSTTVTRLFDTARPATALSSSSSSGAAGEGQEEEAKDAQHSTTVTRLFDTARPATALSPSSSSGAAGVAEKEEAKDAQPSTTVTRLFDTVQGPLGPSTLEPVAPSLLSQALARSASLPSPVTPTIVPGAWGGSEALGGRSQRDGGAGYVYRRSRTALTPRRLTQEEETALYGAPLALPDEEMEGASLFGGASDPAETFPPPAPPAKAVHPPGPEDGHSFTSLPDLTRRAHNMVLSSPPQDPGGPLKPCPRLAPSTVALPAPPPPPPSQTSQMLSVLDTPRCADGGEAAVTPGKEMETDASSGRRERDKTTGGTPSTGPSNASVRTVTFAALTPATPLSPPCPEEQASKPKHRVGSGFKKLFRLPRLGRSPTTSPLSPHSPPASSLTHLPGSPQSQLPQQQQPPPSQGQQHITRPSPFPFPFRRSETKMSAAVVTSSASKELSSLPPPRRAVPSSLSSSSLSSSLSSSSSSSSPSSFSPSSSALASSSKRAIDSPTSWPSPSPELRDRLQRFTRRLSRTKNR